MHAGGISIYPQIFLGIISGTWGCARRKWTCDILKLRPNGFSRRYKEKWEGLPQRGTQIEYGKVGGKTYENCRRGRNREYEWARAAISTLSTPSRKVGSMTTTLGWRESIFPSPRTPLELRYSCEISEGSPTQNPSLVSLSLSISLSFFLRYFKDKSESSGEFWN